MTVASGADYRKTSDDMPDKEWADFRDMTDAPAWYGAGEASAWASGWNHAVSEVPRIEHIYVIKYQREMDGSGPWETGRVYLTEREAIEYASQREHERVTERNYFLTCKVLKVTVGDEFHSELIWDYRPAHKDYGFVDERDFIQDAAQHLLEIARELQ